MLESIKLDIIKEIEILNETDFNSETKRYEDNIKNAKKNLDDSKCPYEGKNRIKLLIYNILNHKKQRSFLLTISALLSFFVILFLFFCFTTFNSILKLTNVDNNIFYSLICLVIFLFSLFLNVLSIFPIIFIYKFLPIKNYTVEKIEREKSLLICHIQNKKLREEYIKKIFKDNSALLQLNFISVPISDFLLKEINKELNEKQIENIILMSNDKQITYKNLIFFINNLTNN